MTCQIGPRKGSTCTTYTSKGNSSDAFVKYTGLASCTSCLLGIGLNFKYYFSMLYVSPANSTWQVGHLYAWNVKDFPSPIDVPKLRKACDRLSDPWNSEIALWLGSMVILDWKGAKNISVIFRITVCRNSSNILDQFWCFSYYENFEKFFQKSHNLSVTNVARDRMLKLSNGTSMAFVANKVIWFHFATPSISINLY